MVLRKIVGSKCEEAGGDWRKVHKNLYWSPNIIRVIKFGRWLEYLACLEEEGKFIVGYSRTRKVKN
jgi:hypothetical protein